MRRRAFLKTTAGSAILSLSFNSRIFASGAADKPNILWITSEDNSVRWIGCYGNPHAYTPNIDKLAAEGFRYTHCFANAPVCAPQRFTWITGIHALSVGTQPMRSSYEIPQYITCYPMQLGKAGYACANDKKTDYNLRGRGRPPTDKNSTFSYRRKDIGWNSDKSDVRKKGKPFFEIINLESSHEFRAFALKENTKQSPEDVTLPKYHPDLPVIRQNYASYQDAVNEMDAEVGQALDDLEKQGLAESTIVIYCSDQGGVMPRSKRFLYDSGTHCPLVIRIPEKFKHLWPSKKPGDSVDRLVSFVDLPKTWLNIAGADIPDTMQGKIFLGASAEHRDYHFCWRGRMDERLDNVRAVRDKKYLYIKNYMPWAPWGQRLNFMWKMPATQAWEDYHAEGKTDAVTGLFFEPKPYIEELYDTAADPDNINNLANNPEINGTLEKMRSELRKWQLEIHDTGLIPESERGRLAEEGDTTIYEIVRNPDLYDLPAYLDAADIALAGQDGNIGILLEYLDHKDLAIRYWGIVGIFMMGKEAASQKARITGALQDESHEVRAMAAWILVRLGDKEAGIKALDELMKNRSYAMLTVLNIIDWMGEDARPLWNTAQSLGKLPGYSNNMLKNLPGGENIDEHGNKRRKE